MSNVQRLQTLHPRLQTLVFGIWTDQFRCEPIEQGRMGGSIPLYPKIARGSSQAAAEMIMPEAVHHHSGGQRVLWIGEDVSQRSAPAGRIDRRRGNNASRLGAEDL